MGAGQTDNETETEIEQDKRDIKRGSTLNILGFLARLCARVPFLFIAGRLYGAETYGEYVLLTALVETTALLSTFGLKRTIFRFITQDREDTQSTIRHALAISLSIALMLVALIQLIAAPILGLFDAPSAHANLLVLSCAIPVISLTDVFLSAILSRRILRYEIIVRSFVEPILLTLLSLILFYVGYREGGMIYAFLAAFTSAAVVSAVLCVREFGSAILFGPLRLSTLAYILRHSSFTCVHDLVRVLFTKIDTFAVGYFFSTSTVGVYGMAQQFLTIVEKVAASFYPMLMPVVSEAVHSADRTRLFAQLRSAAGRLVLLQLPVVALFYAFGTDLLGFIGPEFPAAWPVLMILALGCWMNSVMQLAEVPLTYMRPHINVLASVLAVLAYVAAVSTLQRVLGVEGIAATSVAATALSNVLLLVVFARAVRTLGK